MPRKSKYITKHDLYEYWVDEQNVTIHAMIGSGQVSKFDHLNWRPDKGGEKVTRKLASGEAIEFRRVKSKRGSYIFVSHYFHFNFNRDITLFLKKRFGIGRLESSSYPAGDNFVHLQLIDRMQEEGLSHAAVRAAVDEVFWNALVKRKREIKRFIRRKMRIDLDKWNLQLEHSLHSVEIMRDVRGAPHEEMYEDPRVMASFRRNVFNIQMCEKDSEGRVGAAELVKSRLEGGVTHRMMLRGERPDSSIEKCYHKHSCARGSLNRVERVFAGKEVIKQAAGRSHRFGSLEDYRDLIGRLIKVTFEGHMKMYHFEKTSDEKVKYRKLRGYCIELFGKHSREAFRALKHDGFLSTRAHRGSPAYKPIARIAPGLAKRGVLLREVKRGIYGVDWNFVMSGKRSS